MSSIINLVFKRKRILISALSLLLVIGVVLSVPENAGVSNAATGTYTLTFISAEGYLKGKANTTELTYTVTKGECIRYDRPDKCYANGRAVKGWRVGNTSEVINVADIEDYIPKGDTTFYAVWSDAYSMTFYSEYDTFRFQNDKKNYVCLVAKGNEMTETLQMNNSLDGKEFDYWLRDDGKKFTYVTGHVPERNETFTAVWAEQCKLTFNCDGGYIYDSDTSDKKVVTFKKGVKMGYGMPRPHKDGCYFTGWKLEETGEIFKDSVRGTFDHDIEVVAQWTEAYNLTFNSAEGYIFGDSKRTEYKDQVKIGNKISSAPNSYNWSGHAIHGWKDTATGVIYTKTEIKDITPTGDMVFEAVWGESITLTVDANGGVVGNGINNLTYSEQLSKGVYDHQDHFLSADREGYIFKGWKREGEDKIYYQEVIAGVFNEDTIYYAQWAEAVTVKLDPNGGYFLDYYSYEDRYLKTAEPKEKKFEKGLKASFYDLSDPLNDNATTFYGWKTEDGSELYTTQQILDMTFDKSTVFYAVWEAPNNSGDEGSNNGENTNNGNGSNNGGNTNNAGNSNNSENTNNGGDTNNNEGSGSNDAAPTYSSEWVNGLWYNADSSQTYPGILEWKCNSTGWWVEDTTGWYPVSQWQKIDGIWYYFNSSGYMASNEYYDGYWLNSDGSCAEQYYLTWKCNSTGWWAEDISGWWPASQWLKVDGCWYYFNSSGYMVVSQYIDGYWIGADGVCQ
ncbi:MAG: InlB B-repeat-containing protein [Eubacterium sp.]|nr:InlB B-repeat-containing protein [Eubacterium sp.]